MPLIAKSMKACHFIRPGHVFCQQLICAKKDYTKLRIQGFKVRGGAVLHIAHINHYVNVSDQSSLFYLKTNMLISMCSKRLLAFDIQNFSKKETQ